MTRDEASLNNLCVWADGAKTPKHELKQEPVCGGRRMIGSHYCAEHVQAAYGNDNSVARVVYVSRKAAAITR